MTYEKIEKIDDNESDKEVIEGFMKPLEGLLGTDLFKPENGLTNWVVEVKWKEPKIGEEGSIISWQEFSVEGKLNNDFLLWARKHYGYWISKAHVPIEVVSIKKNYTGGIDSHW
jgi:hypothetical protein